MISWLYQILARLQALFFKSRMERELDEELKTHIDLLIKANIERGRTPESAKREALLKMGSRDAARELYRDARGFCFVEDFLQDASFSVRLLLRNPLFVLL